MIRNSEKNSTWVDHQEQLPSYMRDKTFRVSQTERKDRSKSSLGAHKTQNVYLTYAPMNDESTQIYRGKFVSEQAELSFNTLYNSWV